MANAEKVENTAKKAAEATAKATTEAFESVMNFNPASMQQGYEKFSESMTAFADIQKSSFEALAAANKAYVKGFEQVISEQSAFFQDAFEDYTTNAQKIASVGGVQEAFDASSEYVRACTEKNMNQFNKVSEICVNATQDTIAPLSERYGALVEKIQAFRP